MSRAAKLAEEIAVSVPRKQPPRPKKAKPDATQQVQEAPPGAGAPAERPTGAGDGAPTGTVAPAPTSELKQPVGSLPDVTGDGRDGGWFPDYWSD